ncbi:MAG TPA: lipoprotein [Burkholderiales bacterium]|nr:lipoprotein [Burkholderiales bacterium]
MRNVPLLLSMAALLSACGMKGPLHLPQEPAAQAPASAPAAGAQAGDKKMPAAGQTGQ